MGLLVEGVWKDRWYDTESTGGKFVRKDSSFRHWITEDGSSGFPVEAGRYRLYVSYACPWAHRALIFRALKGLEGAIDVVVVEPDMREHGWVIRPEYYLYQVYQQADADYTGRVTVPVLWDTKQETIVNNESSEIIRMMDGPLSSLSTRGRDVRYWPEALRQEIEAVNERVYHDVNNGVYKCGFATRQDAYEDAYDRLFDTLDWLEERLGRTRYLMGSTPTEADWRLFTTLIRFDVVYYAHFKCNRNRIVDFEHLWGYLRDLYQCPGVAETVHFDHIKQHYFASHESINPTRIVPVGPLIDFTTAHGRG